MAGNVATRAIERGLSDATTTLLAALPGHRPTAIVRWPGWAGDHPVVGWETFDVSARTERRERARAGLPPRTSGRKASWTDADRTRILSLAETMTIRQIAALEGRNDDTLCGVLRVWRARAAEPIEASEPAGEDVPTWEMPRHEGWHVVSTLLRRARPALAGAAVND